MTSPALPPRIDAGCRDPSSAFGCMVEPAGIADGVHFLCSDAARAITGIVLLIDTGWLARVTYVQYPGWPPED